MRVTVGGLCCHDLRRDTAAKQYPVCLTLPQWQSVGKCHARRLPPIWPPMRWSCLTILPGCFQIGSEVLQIDDQWLLNLRIQSTTINPVP